MAAVVVAGILLGSNGDTETQAATRASPAGTSSQSTTPTAAPDDVAASPAPRPSTPELVDQAQVDETTSEVRGVAATAVAAWQIPDSAARTAALTPLATPEFLRASTTIDPTLVPTSPVASSSTLADSDGMARVRVTLKDGTILLVDLQLATAWLVDSILPGI